MNKFIKILSLLLIIILVSGCVDNQYPNTDVQNKIVYKILKIDARQIFYYDENGFIKSKDVGQTYFIESNNTRLEWQNYNYPFDSQYVAYINITK